MKSYHTNVRKLSGTDYREVYRKAFSIYKRIKSHSKRRPYVRSAYFGNHKIFLGLFWEHLGQKNWQDRFRRLKFFHCAIDLIRNSRQEPALRQNPNKPNEVFYRFAGLTNDKELFQVQIKEDKTTSQKWLLSVFPV